MKKRKIKKLPKSQQLLSPVITDISESNDNPYMKYSKKYFNALGETSNKKISMLAEGLQEILNDKTNYKINIEQTDKPYDIIEKYIPNMKCHVTRKYLEEIVRKLKNDEDLTKVQEQVKRHIINGTKKHSPKPVPNVGDTIITDDGNKGIVTEKRGLKFKIKTNNGYITENLKNIIFVKNNKNKKIKEEIKLDKFFESFDYDKQIVTELFKADSDVEINKKGNNYYFTIDGNEYFVSNSMGYIVFNIINEDGKTSFKPTNNNKNQYLILNTVIKCIDLIFKSGEDDFYYFSGSNENGLAKLYSIMFNKLKDKSRKYNLLPFFTDNYIFEYGPVEFGWDGQNYFSNPSNRYWYFINPNTKKGKELIDTAKEQNLPFINQLKESRIDELFKADSDVEINKEGDTYSFSIDDNNYRVYLHGREILFANTDEISSNRFKPMKNNKNQFLVLNTVLKCIEDMLKSEKGYYYFTGDESLGLAKLYDTMFKRLKNDAVNLGYVAIKLNSLKTDREEETFCFYPKSDFTMDNYESIIGSYPYAEFYGFKLPDNYIPIPENNYYYNVEEISDNEYYFKPNEILECEVSFEENDSDGKNRSEINIKLTDESALKNKYVSNTICRIIKDKMYEDYQTYYFYSSNALEDKIAHITSDKVSREYYISTKKVNNYDLYMFTPIED